MDNGNNDNRKTKAVQEYRDDYYNQIYKQPKSNQLQKQIIIIIACVVVIGSLAGIYFAVLKPMVEKTLETTTEEIPLLEGEELGPGLTNRVLITPKVERKDTKSVYVKNKVDEFKVIHHLGEDYYYVEGAELAPVNQENLVNFYTNCTYLLSMMRVAGRDIEDGNEILGDLEQFGFNDECAYFIVTKTDDTYYKIIIGDKIPTTGGYYVMYEDKNGLRDAVYIIDTMMEENVLNTRYTLLQPIVCKPINMMTESIYIDNFKFYKGRELFVEIFNGDIPVDSDWLVWRQMRYPAPYTVSDNYSNLLTTFSNFAGTRVVHAFRYDEEISEDILVEYGFDDYTGRIMFEFKDEKYDFFFSKPNEEGNYYVFSNEFATIVEVTPDIVPFLEWDLLKFVDKPIFIENINDVSEITIKVPGKADVVFNIEITAVDEETGRITELTVTGNGKVIEMPNPDDKFRVDKIWNFRQYYKSILSIDMVDYQADVSETSELLLQMVIKKKNGELFDYKFYFVPTNTRRSFYSVNGVGDFYVQRDKVKKLIEDTERVMQNLPVNADAPE